LNCDCWSIRVHRFGSTPVNGDDRFEAASGNGTSTSTSTSALEGSERCKISTDAVEGIRLMAAQAVCALYELHRSSIIHADIKPENCFLDIDYKPSANNDQFQHDRARWDQPQSRDLNSYAAIKPEYAPRSNFPEASKRLHPLDALLVGPPAESISHQTRGSGAAHIERRHKIRFVLADFGNSIHTSELESYYDEYEIQTLQYRAPEALLGLSLDTKLDMWSLGIVLLELCCGRTLFDDYSRTQDYQVRKRLQLEAISDLLVAPCPAAFRTAKYASMLGKGTTIRAKNESHLDVEDIIEDSDEEASRRSGRRKDVHSTGSSPRLDDRKTPLNDNQSHAALLPKIYQLLYKHYVGFPPDLVHFLAGLLQNDPDMRLSPLEALSHPFLQRGTLVPTPYHLFADATERLSDSRKEPSAESALRLHTSFTHRVQPPMLRPPNSKSVGRSLAADINRASFEKEAHHKIPLNSQRNDHHVIAEARTSTALDVSAVGKKRKPDRLDELNAADTKITEVVEVKRPAKLTESPSTFAATSGASTKLKASDTPQNSLLSLCRNTAPSQPRMGQPGGQQQPQASPVVTTNRLDRAKVSSGGLLSFMKQQGSS
jgi:serine/threonine protein kinase